MKSSKEKGLFPATWTISGIEAEWVFFNKIVLNTVTVTSKLT